jgi:hypothetical protein
MRKPTSWVLFGILVLTTIIGFYLRYESGFETRVVAPFRADARDYYMYAYNLRHKQTYSRDITSLTDVRHPVEPDALRSPGYPLFLSIFVDGPPDNRTIVTIVFAQMILSNLVLVLAFCFYKRFLSGYWAVAALLLTALSPHLIVANSYLLTETLFCLLLILSGWLLSLFFFRPSLSLAAVSGLGLGIATLIRPGLQYFPLVLAAILVVHYGRRKGFYFVTALLFGYLLVLSPWIIRNIKVFHSISDDTLKINFLHHGMYPEFKYDGLDKSYGFPYRYDPRSGEISKSTASVLNEIERRFRDEPAQHLKWYLIRKPAIFWSWNIIQGLGDVFTYPIHQTPYQSNFFFRWTHRLMRYLHWPLVMLCAAGSLMVWLPRLKYIYPEKPLYVARFVAALLLYFTVIHVIGAPFPRYSIPLRPFLYGMAIFCLHLFYTSVKTRKENI